MSSLFILRNQIISFNRTIVQEEGVKGLFKGLGPHLIGVTPSRLVQSIHRFIIQSLDGINSSQNE